jgi:predicted aminopeptidase
MGILRSLFLIFFISGCAKLNYLYEQGVGQISLQAKAKDNKEVLQNVRIPKDQKEKIKRIEELKQYFYSYWNKKQTRIYTQTTMLENKAVTYLVVASPYNEIKAVENCFPLMGCFPYLGFFNLTSAQSFAKEREGENLVTWLRPVYAYSTLGYFNDTILSSFFHYTENELAELVFHELFHTIFFVKNEVELNENLANYFAKQMVEEYFIQTKQLEYLKIKQKEEKEDKILRQLVVNLTAQLQEHYQSLLPKTKEESQTILDEFLDHQFYPTIKKKCSESKIVNKECFPLNKRWNNASFAAFLTYEKRADDIEGLQKKLGVDLKGLFNWIDQRYLSFQNQNQVEEFSEYLTM